MNLDIKLHKEDLPDQIYFQDKIAIDCEFTGLNVERDRLCLVQISSGNNDAHIIQLNKDKYNAPNLKKYLDIKVHNISCTKIMSKIARSYTDKHGLKDLIKELIGIDVSKQLQTSDFGGDLSKKQLEYCANDVVHLHKICEGLHKILFRENRLDLYNKAIKFLPTRVDLDFASFKEDIWSH